MEQPNPHKRIDQAQVATQNQPYRKHFRLTTLPTEILILIFSNLDAVASTCLGLACRRLYPIHWHKYGKLSLVTPVVQHIKSHGFFHHCLAGYLGQWMGGGWRFKYYMSKFVRDEWYGGDKEGWEIDYNLRKL